MRKIIAVAVVLCLGLYLNAQETFVFKNTLQKSSPPELDYSLASSHYLGQDIANKMHLIKETYTYVEQGTPMSPGQKVIVKKPQIYYAIRKLNKYYKKAIKKGSLSEPEAIDLLNETLDKAFVIFDQETQEFEDYLSKQKKPEDMEQAFAMIELK